MHILATNNISFCRSFDQSSNPSTASSYMETPYSLMPNNRHYSVIMDKVHGYENTAVLGITPEYNTLQHFFNQSKASSSSDDYSKLNHSTTVMTLNTDGDIYTSLNNSSMKPLYESFSQ